MKAITDPELKAIAVFAKVCDDLSPEAQRRVIHYLVSRFLPDPVPRAVEPSTNRLEFDRTTN